MGERIVTDAMKYAEKEVYPGQETVPLRAAKLSLEEKLRDKGLPSLENRNLYEGTAVATLMASIMSVAQESFKLIMESADKEVTYEGEKAIVDMFFENVEEGVNPFAVPATFNQLVPVMDLLGEIDFETLKKEVSKRLN